MSLFNYEVYKFTKHHHTSFPLQPYKPSKPFAVIHNDVWGPNKISTLSNNKKWFIAFIDDHTRLCWVYLLKVKFEAGHVVNFFKWYRLSFRQIYKSLEVIMRQNILI